MASGDTAQSLLGTAASESTARACLEHADVGVLGLTREGEAYTIPVSFGYDAEVATLYFLFGFTPDSKKRRFMETTGTASFTVFQTDLPDAWESAIATGPIGPVPDDETDAAYAALSDTATFPALYTFEDVFEKADLEQVLYALDVETLTARRAHQEESVDAA